ncbi:dihydrolipoyl dehydrogenase, partial [bacterium]|nr:dihydrolipoyl dehydrogenase [bacterium]
GYVAAFLASDLGMKVTLIDPEQNPGGVCLHYGCIPSKTLLHIAKLITETKEASKWGVSFGEPKIDIDKLRAWKNTVVRNLTGGTGQLAKRRNIEYIRGKAVFADSSTLNITKVTGESETLSFEKAIIAVGSRPAVIPKLSIDSPRILNSTTALELENIPESLLIIGGGYIGLELGTVYAHLGSSVSIVEMMPALLPGADADLVATFYRTANRTFESIMLNTTVAEINEQSSGIKVTFEGNFSEEKIYEKVLISVGRRPNSENIGLKNTNIEVDEKGFIKVNPQRRTAEPSIYAIGDIAGEPLLAHKASAEGKIAVEAIAGENVEFNPRAIPGVVFTDPEIAWCGLTASQAKEKNINVEIAKFPWAASGRAATLGRNDGLTKLIIDPENHKILGVGIVGPGAGEL